MINIAYCIYNIGMGGAERHLLKVVKYIDRGKFKPLLFCLGDSHQKPLRDDFLSAGVEIFDLNLSGHLFGPSTLRGALSLAELMRDKGVRIAHGYLYEGNLFGLLSGKLSGIPVISSRRSIDHYSMPIRFISKLCNTFSTRVTANSKGVADFMVKEEGCKPEKIVLIPNGVETDVEPFSESEKRVLRQSWGIPERAFVVGTVARFFWKKGYEYFIKAATRVTRKSPEVYFLSIGDGPMRGQIEELAKEFGIGSKVAFAGWQEEVQQKMRVFDVYVCASVIEGMSNALLEAMAQGLPVVATAVGGNKENVVDGITGFLVPPAEEGPLADAILRLVDNPSLLREMGQKGRERILTGFSVKGMVRRIEDLYLSLLNDRRNGTSEPVEGTT